MNTSKRLDALLKMTAAQGADPFAFYALAMEYKSLSRSEDALGVFGQLRASHPEYVPMYLMCGTMLTELGRRDEAGDWLREGLRAAKAKGDTHAYGELEGALSTLAP